MKRRWFCIWYLFWQTIEMYRILTFNHYLVIFIINWIFFSCYMTIFYKMFINLSFCFINQRVPANINMYFTFNMCIFDIVFLTNQNVLYTALFLFIFVKMFFWGIFFNSCIWYLNHKKLLYIAEYINPILKYQSSMIWSYLDTLYI